MRIASDRPDLQIGKISAESWVETSDSGPKPKRMRTSHAEQRRPGQSELMWLTWDLLEPFSTATFLRLKMEVIERLGGALYNLNEVLGGDLEGIAMLESPPPE